MSWYRWGSRVYDGFQRKNELEVYHGVQREDRPGDLIVAVAGQRVRDAHEFNDRMRRFGAGDTVTFAVQRGDARVRLSAQLEAEP